MNDDRTARDEDPPADENAWQRKRRLAAVFGDVLPDTTSDERTPDPVAEGEAGDRWLQEQVPPHHG